MLPTLLFAVSVAPVLELILPATEVMLLAVTAMLPPDEVKAKLPEGVTVVPLKVIFPTVVTVARARSLAEARTRSLVPTTLPLTVRLPVDVVILLLPTEAAEKVKAPLFSTLTAAAFVPVSVLTTVFSGEVELPIVTPPVSCSVVAVMSAVPPPVVKVPFELITIAPLVPLLLKPAEPSVMSLPLIVKVSVPVRVNVRPVTVELPSVSVGLVPLNVIVPD